MASKFRPAASKIRPLLQAVRGGCRPDNPRLACRVAKAVRKAGSKVQDELPGIKTKAQAAYEVWKNSVDAGDEFIIRIHKTGKIIIFVTAPFALLKIAYSEYTRSDETADPGSQYEQTRAAAIELLHYADPALARLVQFFFPDLKKPEPATDHDRDFTKRVLREVDEIYQEGLQDAFDHIWEKLLREQEAKKLNEEEEAKKLKEEEEEAKKLKEEEAEKQEVEAASSGMMEWISSLFWGKDKDSAVSDKRPAGADAAADNKAAIGGPHGGVATSTGKGADPGSSGAEDKVRPPGGV